MSKVLVCPECGELVQARRTTYWSLDEETGEFVLDDTQPDAEYYCNNEHHLSPDEDGIPELPMR